MGRIGSVADRTVVGIGITVSGFVLIAISWLGVSGRAELADQIPWLLLGIAGLIVAIAGGALIALRHTRRSARALTDLERDITALHDRAGADRPGRHSGPEQVLVPPDARTFHRRGCALLQGKDDAAVTTPDEARTDGYDPCPLCQPTG